MRAPFVRSVSQSFRRHRSIFCPASEIGGKSFTLLFSFDALSVLQVYENIYKIESALYYECRQFSARRIILRLCVEMFLRVVALDFVQEGLWNEL